MFLEKVKVHVLYIDAVPLMSLFRGGATCAFRKRFRFSLVI